MNDSLRLGAQLLLDGLAVLFLVSGLAKALGRQRFEFGLLRLPLMTRRAARWLSWALPPMEIGLAVLLYANVAAAKWAAIGLLVAFIGVAAVAVLAGRQVPCGCFGDLDGQTLSGRTIVRNLALIAVAGLTLALDRRIEWWVGPWYAALGLVLILVAKEAVKNHRHIYWLREEGVLW